MPDVSGNFKLFIFLYTTHMKTVDDISYGIVPYIREEGVLQFFLIHQFSKWGGDYYWVFPKGHAEGEESPEETARRELEEETQLQLASLDTERTFEIKYEFTIDGTLTKKTSVFYIGEAAAKSFVLQEDEVIDAAWLTYEEAREKITYENTKQLLDEVVEYLNT